MLFKTLFDKKSTVDNSETGRGRELIFRVCYRSICYEVYLVSDKECFFIKNYRFAIDDSNDTLPDLMLSMPAIKKERTAPIAYLDFLCVIVDNAGVKDLCDRIEASDDSSTKLLTSDELQIIIKRKGLELSHCSNSLNYHALLNKKVIQEIKGLLFNIELFYSEVFDMNDEQLIEQETRISSVVNYYNTNLKGK